MGGHQAKLVKFDGWGTAFGTVLLGAGLGYWSFHGVNQALGAPMEEIDFGHFIVFGALAGWALGAYAAHLNVSRRRFWLAVIVTAVVGLATPVSLLRMHMAAADGRDAFNMESAVAYLSGLTYFVAVILPPRGRAHRITTSPLSPVDGEHSVISPPK